MFLNSANLSLNTNLRSVTIDSLILHHVPSQIDSRFSPLIAMLSRIASPTLDTISLNLAPLTYYGDINNVPWDQLARIFTMHLGNLQFINIILPGIAVGESGLPLGRNVIASIELQMAEMEGLIMANLKAVQLDARLLAITNISFPHL